MDCTAFIEQGENPTGESYMTTMSAATERRASHGVTGLTHVQDSSFFFVFFLFRFIFLFFSFFVSIFFFRFEKNKI
jgi:hypothetical protein